MSMSVAEARQTPASRAHPFFAACAALTLILTTMFVGALPARAAEISNAITDAWFISKPTGSSPTGDPYVGRTHEIGLDWCVPNGTEEGDTFRLKLPPEIENNTPLGFNLTHPTSGEVVAVAALTDPTNNALEYTFTMTAYAASHINTCGTARMDGRLDADVAIDVETELEFIANEGGATEKIFTDTITPRRGPGTDYSQGVKNNRFLRVDQGRLIAWGAVEWLIYAPAGPATNVVITDTLALGQTFECSSPAPSAVIGRISDTTGSFVGLGPWPASNYTVDCSPNALTITIPSIPADRIIRFSAISDFLVPTGLTTPAVVTRNTVQFNWNDVNGVPRQYRTYSDSRQSAGQGNGEGENPEPIIGIVKTDADGNDANTPGDAVDLGTAPGSTDLEFTLTNTGTDPLVDISVTDVSTNGTVENLSCNFEPLGGPATGTTWAGPWIPGSSTVDCTARLTGVEAGTHVNTATITGTGIYSGTTVTEDDPYHAEVTEAPQPAITIVKADAAGNDANTDPVNLGLAPASTDLVFTIENTGDEALRDIVVTDAINAGSGSITGLSCNFEPLGGPATGTIWAGPFAPDATFNCTATLSGVTAEQHTDTATVVGTGVGSGTTVTDDDPYNAVADTPVPVIEIIKGDVDGNAGDDSNDPVRYPAGITSKDLTFTISNDGEEALRDITVTDTINAGPATVADLVCTFPDGSTGTTWAGPFAVDGTFDCTATLEGMVAGELHTDTASVTGTGVVSGVVVDDDNPYNAITDAPVSVGDYVWIDANRDGLQDGSDVPVQGATMILTDLDGNPVLDIYDTPVAPAITNEDGFYEFVNLPPGQYRVTIDPSTAPSLDGHNPTIEVGAPTDGDNSSTGSADSVVLNPGDRDETLDFGFVPVIVSVGDYTWLDIDQDGVQDEGEPVVPGVTVILRDAEGNEVNRTVTDENGFYSFTDLTPSTEYQIEFVLPSGHIFTSQDAGADDALDSDADPATGLVTFTTPATGANSATAPDDPTIDAGFIVPTPQVEIIKADTAGNDANDVATSVDLVDADGTTGLVFTITNTGGEALTDVSVTDAVVEGGAAVTGLTCDFSPLGGPSEGTTWAGPFAVGDFFNCTATLSGVTVGDHHANVATITGTGQVTGTPVTDDDPYHADVTPEPGIEIVKGDSNGNAADTSDDAVTLGPDGSADLVFTITNRGNEPLVNVEVTDVVVSGGTVADLVCTFPDGSTGTTWAGPFAVGGTFDCTARLTGVTPDEAHEDVATVTGEGEVSGTPVTDDNPYHAEVTPEPEPTPTPTPTPEPTPTPTPMPPPGQKPPHHYDTGEVLTPMNMVLVGIGATALIGALTFGTIAWRRRSGNGSDGETA